MFAWSTTVIFVLSLMVAGPLRESVPFWLHSSAELLAVISLFVLVCFLETGGGNPDRSEPVRPG